MPELPGISIKKSKKKKRKNPTKTPPLQQDLEEKIINKTHKIPLEYWNITVHRAYSKYLTYSDVLAIEYLRKPKPHRNRKTVKPNIHRVERRKKYPQDRTDCNIH